MDDQGLRLSFSSCASKSRKFTARSWGARHMAPLSGLSTPLFLQAASLKAAPAGGSWHSGQSGSEGGEGKEPLLAWVQLGSPGCHLLLVTSHEAVQPQTPEPLS